MPKENGMAQPNDHAEHETYALAALTSIRGPYTLAATDEPATEVDRVTVRRFIETIAEVSLAIASRIASRLEQGK
jgi:hypothetical protein